MHTDTLFQTTDPGVGSQRLHRPAILLFSLFVIFATQSYVAGQTGPFINAANFIGPVAENVGVVLFNADSDPELESFAIPLPHLSANQSFVEFHVSPDASVVMARAFGAAMTGSCSIGGNQIYFFGVNLTSSSGGTLTEIYNENLCINGPVPDHVGLYYVPGQPQRVAFLVEPGQFSGSMKRLHLFNLNGLDEHAIVLLNDDITIPFLFSPDGTMAFIKHGVANQPTDSDYTLIDLCADARFGNPLITFNNLSGPPIASVVEFPQGSGQLVARIEHPQITTHNEPLIPCGAVMGACCNGQVCSEVLNINCAGTFTPGGSCSPDPCIPVMHTLIVTKTGAGTGFVTSTPGGIACGITCEADFTDATTVTLNASPSFDSTFSGWSGACSGSNPSVQVVLDADKTCTANFGLRMSDLRITKSDNTDPVVAGMPLVYTVSVENLGPHDASSVVVTDTLPAEVQYASCSGSTGNCTHASGIVTWNINSLLVGATATLTMTVNVDGAARGTFTNTADVTALQPDPNPGDNSTSESTTTMAMVDLSLTKIATPDPVPQGGDLIYTLYVTNAGPSDALGVTIDDTLPAGVTTTDGRGSLASTTPVQCNVASVRAGETVPVGLFVVLAPSLAPGTILTNSAIVSTSDPEANLANNAATVDATVTDPIGPLGVTSFTRIADNTTAVPGTGGTFAGVGTPANDGGRLAFSARNDSATQGVYLWDNGTMSRVADTNTPLPGGGTLDSIIGEPSIEGANVSYSGLGPGTAGQYALLGGLQTLIARIGLTPLPGLSGTIGNWSSGWLDNGRIAFYATRFCGQEGLYLWNQGQLSSIADTNTPIPGGSGTFTSFHNCVGGVPGPCYQDNQLVFAAYGSNGQYGVYTAAGGLKRLLDLSTPSPIGSAFLSVNPPVTDLGIVAISANTDSGVVGYLQDCLGTHVIVDPTTPYPGSTLPFGFVPPFFGAGRICMDDGMVVFFGVTPDSSAIGMYGYQHGQIFKILESSDMLDGDTGTPNYRREGLSGNLLAFRHLRNSGQALYVAEIGEVTNTVLLGDMNCDGVVDLNDTAPFARALTDPAGYLAAFPNCDINNGDMSQDGSIDGADIAGFVAAQIGP